MSDEEHDPLSDEMLAANRSSGVDAMRQLEVDCESGLAAAARAAPDDEAIIDWCERELGVRLRTVPKVLAILRLALVAFRKRKILRLAVLGPRGGGKTYLAAVIELVAYRFFGYDWNNIGASLEQAQRCYDHVRDAHLTSPDLAAFTLSCQATETRSKAGGKIEIHAASQKSIRGAHPVGPSGAGGLTLDEAALIEDRLIDASKGQLTSADPSALIQLSTMGEQQVGRFWDLIQAPAFAFYELRKFDAFDVAKRCPYDCKTTCPVKAHFAENYYEGEGTARRLVHTAYCAGRAHEVDGWMPIDEIAQQFVDNPRSTFERELLGKAVAIAGYVYDPTLIDAAVIHDRALSKDPATHRRRFMQVQKVASVDWGYAGATAICYSILLRDTVVVYSWDYFSREQFQKIREHLLKRCFEEHIEIVSVDSANPSDNEHLAEMSSEQATARGLDWNPKVLPVVFSRFKEYGIGEVRRRLEQGLLKFCADFGGQPVVGHDMALRFLKSYHTDKLGKPVKVDDHVPDALLMNCIVHATSFRAATHFIGGK